MKIINRKVHDLQIKHRKIERIENKIKMILQKQIDVLAMLNKKYRTPATKK